MESAALAYFLTWTTHGTRLHGDERGTVDRKHNGYDTPKLKPSEAIRAFERSELAAPAVMLDNARREIVRSAIERHAAYRGWDLLALSVRSNHVHLVVRNHGVAPERAMSEFKAWATRDLREARSSGPDARVWTVHGSTRHLFEADDVIGAVRYVEESQNDVARFVREAEQREYFDRLKRSRADG